MAKTAAAPNTRDVVISAIKKLTKNTGWTCRTIVKFIKREYRIGDQKFSRKVSRALKRAVNIGLLQVERGRYRLKDMSRFACPSSASEIHVQHKPRRRERPHLRIRSRSRSR